MGGGVWAWAGFRSGSRDDEFAPGAWSGQCLDRLGDRAFGGLGGLAGASTGFGSRALVACVAKTGLSAALHLVRRLAGLVEGRNFDPRASDFSVGRLIDGDGDGDGRSSGRL